MNDVNLNLSTCFKEINHLGSTTYQNICNNTQSVVPWGVADWVVVVLIVTILALFTLFIGIMVFDIIFDF